MITTKTDIFDLTVSDALKVVRCSGVILYPTDTVWGIGCDACDQAAVKKVFEIKRREDSKSLVLLAASLDMVARYIREIPEMALQLVEVNDAPMTIIYPGAMGLAAACVAADGSVGMRIPLAADDESSASFCLSLCRRLGHPLVSTSANISGEPTPKTFDEISSEIISAVDYVVPREFENAATGRSSQIIKVELDGKVTIIRA